MLCVVCSCSDSAVCVLPTQMCETRVGPPYYAPCTSYKLSSEWTQHTDDRQVRSRVMRRRGASRGDRTTHTSFMWGVLSHLFGAGQQHSPSSWTLKAYPLVSSTLTSLCPPPHPLTRGTL